jgi:hypothetical protein
LGGLTVDNGYIQRSAVPPLFRNAERFYHWFQKQKVTLMNTNNSVQDSHLFIVHLRRPTREPGEMRKDPFSEFGSFGLTKCHGRNLMNLQNADDLNGSRLAFVQGGHQGAKLVYLKPRITITRHSDRLEAGWPPDEMPFKYHDAPILVSNFEKSAFPKLESVAKRGAAKTPEAQFASNFRARATRMDESSARELIQVYRSKRRRAPASAIARTYIEALPWPPPSPDAVRVLTYEKLLTEARRSRVQRVHGGRKHSRC